MLYTLLVITNIILIIVVGYIFFLLNNKPAKKKPSTHHYNNPVSDYTFPSSNNKKKNSTYNWDKEKDNFILMAKGMDVQELDLLIDKYQEAADVAEKEGFHKMKHGFGIIADMDFETSIQFKNRVKKLEIIKATCNPI